MYVKANYMYICKRKEKKIKCPLTTGFSFFSTTMMEKSLKTAVWNIEGLSSDKISDPFFVHTLSKFHIVSFVETWSSYSDREINIPNFKLIATNCRKKTQKSQKKFWWHIYFCQTSNFKGYNFITQETF